jgi:hypothetical protein
MWADGRPMWVEDAGIWVDGRPMWAEDSGIWVDGWPMWAKGSGIWAEGNFMWAEGRARRVLRRTGAPRRHISSSSIPRVSRTFRWTKKKDATAKKRYRP